jgi:phosphorylcholine metabolism protein LicD
MTNILHNFTNTEQKATNIIKKKTYNFKKKIVKQLELTKVLRKTKEVLDKLNIPFFLSSGTCLGYLRENKFIDHDYDIDIGIFKKDYTDLIIKEMINNGFDFYRQLGNLETGLELSFRLKDCDIGKKAKIDIFVHYPHNNKIRWHTYMAPEFKKKITYQVTNFDLKKVKFMGINVHVPYPTVKYIREHYGNNWYIPNKPHFLGGNYDYRLTPKSIIQ